MSRGLDRERRIANALEADGYLVGSIAALLEGFDFAMRPGRRRRD